MLALLLHGLPRFAKAEHPQGIPNPIQNLDLGSKISLSGAAPKVQIKCILDPEQIVLDRRGHRIEKRAILADEATLGVLELTLRGQQTGQGIGSLDGAGAIGRDGRTGHVVEEVLDQIAGRISPETGLAELNELADFAVNATEKQLDCRTCVHSARAHRIERARGNPEQAPRVLLHDATAQTVQNGNHFRQGSFSALPPNPVQERALVEEALLRRTRLQASLRYR